MTPTKLEELAELAERSALAAVTAAFAHGAEHGRTGSNTSATAERADKAYRQLVQDLRALAGDGWDAERLDWMALHGSFGVDSVTGELGGNGQCRKAATRHNIDAALQSAQPQGEAVAWLDDNWQIHWLVGLHAKPGDRLFTHPQPAPSGDLP